MPVQMNIVFNSDEDKKEGEDDEDDDIDAKLAKKHK